MNKLFRLVFLPLFLFTLFASPILVNATTSPTTGAYKGLGDQGASKTLEVSAAAGDVTATELPTLVGGFIGVILGILGIILVVYIIQAGIMYMTAAGDPGKVEKAKKIITQAIVGMVIIVAAYAISDFVIKQLTTVSSTSTSKAIDDL